MLCPRVSARPSASLFFCICLGKMERSVSVLPKSQGARIIETRTGFC